MNKNMKILLIRNDTTKKKMTGNNIYNPQIYKFVCIYVHNIKKTLE